MRHATQCLATTDDDVCEVSDPLGYKHVSQFDDEYRDTFGLSPRAFRTALRQAAPRC